MVEFTAFSSQDELASGNGFVYGRHVVEWKHSAWSPALPQGMMPLGLAFLMSYATAQAMRTVYM